jgi:hypothetical protein
MTKHLIILHIPDRLAQPHRPKSLVRSDPGGRAKGANRQRPRPILKQTRLPNAETATFYLKNKRIRSSFKPSTQRSFPIDTAQPPRLPP